VETSDIEKADRDGHRAPKMSIETDATGGHRTAENIGLETAHRGGRREGR
jgi:hypothetical protein